MRREDRGTDVDRGTETDSSIGTITVAIRILSITAIALVLAVVTSQSSSTRAGEPGGATVLLPMIRNAGTPIPPTTPSPSPTPVTLGSQPRIGLYGGVGSGSTGTRFVESGARVGKITISWKDVEPNYSAVPIYSFAAYDSQLRSLEDAGIAAIVEIRGNPSWAASTTCGPIDATGGLEAFHRFVVATVGRYSGEGYGVKNWEFYNEPDNTDVEAAERIGMGCWGDHPREYAQMLAAADDAVKTFDPSSKVLLGGLAFQCNPSCGSDNWFSMDFLDEIIEAGAGSHFDVANLHYFSSQHPAWDANGYDITGKVAALRQVLSRHQLDKPIAVTEMSWTTSPVDAPDREELQARYVPKVLARGLAANLYSMLWFVPVDWRGADYPYGLLDADHTPRPAYAAYRFATGELGRATTIRRLSPSEVSGTAAVEGYAYTVEGEERWVLWARDPSRFDGGYSRTVARLPSNTLGLRDKLGQPIPFASTGQPVSFILDDDPVFVSFSAPG